MAYDRTPPARNRIDGWMWGHARHAAAQGWGLTITTKRRMTSNRDGTIWGRPVERVVVCPSGIRIEPPITSAECATFDAAYEAFRAAVARGDEVAVFACRLLDHDERDLVLGNLGALAFEAEHGIVRVPLQE